MCSDLAGFLSICHKKQVISYLLWNWKGTQWMFRLSLSLLAFYGILGWPTKGHMFWPDLLLKINSDQNICVCVPWCPIENCTRCLAMKMAWSMPWQWNVACFELHGGFKTICHILRYESLQLGPCQCQAILLGCLRAYMTLWKGVGQRKKLNWNYLSNEF